jgi:RNA polymerase sigma-70 factor (ECF subfamily)
VSNSSVQVGEEPVTDRSPASEPASRLVEHFFRHESGRLVAVLARVFGLRNWELVEDMVQSALVEALQAWRAHGVPDNPSAWMHRVARNKVLDALRHRETVLRLAPAWAQLRPAATEPAIDDLLLDSQIEDSQLRLMFACCHPILARENQIALTLKSLCGFSNAEIARGLLLAEETVKKRIQRARQQLSDEQIVLEVPRAEDLARRLDSVHQCLYLLFNEGYEASSGDAAIRTDLCEEAVRLAQLLCGHPHCRSPASSALLALMLFHAARFDARTDEEGKLLLLEDQDRTKWSQPLIARARDFLDQSAQGKTISLFHLEAGIALLHCTAASFAETNWRAILELYDALVRLRPSPIYKLNRAIVLAHLDGPVASIGAIQALVGDPLLRDYHFVDATLGELYRRAGDMARAREHLERARNSAHSAPERELLARRLALCVATGVSPNPRSERVHQL